MNSTTFLNNLPLGYSGKILNIHCPDNIKRRLLDLGLINGTKITAIFKSPSGDPTAFEFRNSLIAIRKEESSKIEISQMN